MHCAYRDITDKLGQPVWWDECGVPRYIEFHPKHIHNIYTDEAALLQIACQQCGFLFLVAMSHSHWDVIYKRPLLSEAIKAKQIHYGDPPNYCNCSAGATMNCIDLQVIEFWIRNKETKYEWIRVSELEIKIEENEEEISINELIIDLQEEV